MPCNDPTPTARQQRTFTVLQHLHYLCPLLGEPQPVGDIKSAYADIEIDEDALDPLTAELCALCQRPEADDIIYARNKEARALANWWDEHKEMDKNRLTAEDIRSAYYFATEKDIERWCGWEEKKHLFKAQYPRFYNSIVGIDAAYAEKLAAAEEMGRGVGG